MKTYKTHFIFTLSILALTTPVIFAFLWSNQIKDRGYERSKSFIVNNFNMLADIREKYHVFDITLNDKRQCVMISFKVDSANPVGQNAISEIISARGSVKILVEYSDRKTVFYE